MLTLRNMDCNTRFKIPYYFEFKVLLFFSIFPNSKLGCILNSRYHFFTLRTSRKGRFPRKTIGLSKRVVNFTDSEMYLLAKIFDILNSLIISLETSLLLSNYHPIFPPENPFLKLGCMLNH